MNLNGSNDDYNTSHINNLSERHNGDSITEFPTIVDTMELVYLSKQVYKFRFGAANCEAVSPHLGNEYTCHMYERDEQDTQVMVVSNEKSRFVAVVYCGTDDFRNILTDSNI